MLDNLRGRGPRRRSVTIEGQISETEASTLFMLAARVPHGQCIVEVGSYRGRSAVALANGSRAGHGVRVYAIDPHVRFTGVLGGEFGPDDQAALYANLTRAGVGDLVSVVSLSSAVCAPAWREPVGLLFLDGDHAEEAVRADVAAWLPHLAAGATLVFHDSSFEGVARVLADLVERRMLREIGRVDSLAWFAVGAS